MNQSFRAVYEAAFPVIKEELTHTQRVTRLYRSSLKLLFSWAVKRDVFLKEAGKIRAEFNANRNCTKEQAGFYIKQANKRLRERVHPDPYRIPWMPGGSKFMRNPTPPNEVVYRDGEIPVEAYTGTNTPMHLDSIPITFRPLPTVQDPSVAAAAAVASATAAASK